MSGETFYRSSINLETKPISSEVAYAPINVKPKGGGEAGHRVGI